MFMALAATAALGTAAFSAPASAQTAPVNDLVAAIQKGDVKSDYVQYPHIYRGGPRYVQRGYYGRPYYGRGYYGPRYGYYRHYNHGNALAAGALGLATGAIIGGAIAQSQAAPAYQGNAYCAQRFKSYDPASGTYLGYDGVRHPCP
jgi:hypothetical protein